MLKRPLFTSFLFFALGIITGAHFLEHWFLIGVLVFVLTIFGLFLYMPGKSSVLFVIFYIIGVFSVQSSLAVQNYYIENHAKVSSNFIIEGEVTAITLTGTGRQRLTVNARRFETENYVFYEDIRIQAILPIGETVNFGAYIRLFGTLNIPELPSTPGGFNSFMFSRSRGIHYTTFPREFEVLGQASGIRVWLNNLRERIITVFDENLPETQAGLARSMVLGDRTGVDQETIDAYRAAGIYHILIISGLHISFLMLTMYKFLQKFIHKNIAALLAFTFILLYGTMIGFSVSVLRAILMAGVFITAEILHRERDLLTTTAFAAICMLIYEPLQLFDIGSQLSFGAVFGIALFHRPVQKTLLWVLLKLHLKPTKFKALQESLIMDIAITLALTPIFAFHFYRINPYSLFGNLAITFSASIIIILGFLLAVIGLVLEPSAILLAGGLYFLLSFHMAIAMFFYNLPGAFLLVGSPSLIIIAIYYLSLLGIIYIKRKKIVALAVVLAFVVIFITRDTRPTISFMDVGQGKSTIIHYSGKTVVIDGGGPFSRPIGNSTGVNVLVPYLEFHGISYIDKIFLTHEHMDHIVGIIELMSHKTIGSIYTTIGLEPHAYFANIFLEKAEYYGIPVNFIYGPRRFSMNGFFIDLLHPSRYTTFDSINETSLVFRLVYGDTSFLLASDIYANGEKEIMASGVMIESDVLQVGHHGSRTSSYIGFLEAVNPSIAIISAGRGNFYGHPHDEILERLSDLGISIYKTKNEGTITVKTNGREVEIR